MHHNKGGRQLSRNTSHRKAMFRNMVDSLIELEQIETTMPKAKELRRYVDRVITLGKKGGLANYRRALTLMRRKEMVHKLFGELAERYQDRPGGYTRVLHLGPRKGDLAPMALVQLVDRGDAKPEPAKETKKEAKAKKEPAKAEAKSKTEKKTAKKKTTKKKSAKKKSKEA